MARASATGIAGCMRTPWRSAIRSAIVTRRHGGARSTSRPSTATTVVPIAARAASDTIVSTSSIMSR